MKADLPRKEQEFLASWEEEKIYEIIMKKLSGKPLFVLHDGPPYANGHLHMGHAMNKILKDIINRVAIKQGMKTAYVPGWDCHGLPIEHKVLKDIGKKRSDLTALEIRKKCRESARHFSNIQKKEFIRMGVLAEWDYPYLTMDFDYEAEILRSLARMTETGRIYKGEKPVLWCGYCETALADAEVEYAPHKSISVTVLFTSISPADKRHFPIWTTTPWTLPANRAVAVNPDIPYAIFRLTHDTLNMEKGSEFVLAEEIANRLATEEGNPWKQIIESSEFIAKKTGRELIDETPGLRHPFIKNRTVPLVSGTFVGTDQGTGLVHIAPGHGEEDFQVGRENMLGTETPVNEKGRFGEKIGELNPDWIGLRIHEVSPLVTALLKETGTLIFEEILLHSYPHCWRCKNPVFYRATSQWFLSLSKANLREKTLDAIETINWIPEKGENRIRGMIGTRPDWCLSRQRAWGVPIPAIGCRDCGKSTLTAAFINSIADRAEIAGVDFWFDENERADLIAGKKCSHCEGSRLYLEDDILDVWFDSGVSHEAVLKKRANLKWPADLYLEGSDQHRGWFHSSLLTSMALESAPPYTTVLTHGFVVDGQGKKMAKTLGNVIAPSEITDKYGADVLRLWVAAADYQEDTRLSIEILNNLVDSYRKIRNTFRYMLSNLYDYPSASQKEESTDTLDMWILSVWERTKETIFEAYQSYRFAHVVQVLNNFCSISLSAHYFDMIKDRLYAEKSDGILRRGTQNTLYILLEELNFVIHPILPFTSVEISGHKEILDKNPRGESAIEIMTSVFPQLRQDRIRPKIEAQVEKLLPIRAAFGKMVDDLKKEKIIGTTMELHLRISGNQESLNPDKRPDSFYETFFIVSEFSWEQNNSPNESIPVLSTTRIEELGIDLIIMVAEGNKCDRCWQRKKSTGINEEGWSICKRCHGVIIS